MISPRARAAIALVGVVLLGGCAGETEGPTVEEAVEETTVEETTRASIPGSWGDMSQEEKDAMDAKKKAGAKTKARPKPVAAEFDNPEGACVFLLSTEEARANPNSDVVAECRDEYGVTLENAPERLKEVQQKLDELKVEQMREQAKKGQKDE